MQINPEQLLKAEGFDAAFYKLLGRPETTTQRQAFNQLNQAFEQHYGYPRYTDFDSYRVAKHRRLRGNK